MAVPIKKQQEEVKWETFFAYEEKLYTPIRAYSEKVGPEPKEIMLPLNILSLNTISMILEILEHQPSTRKIKEHLLDIADTDVRITTWVVFKEVDMSSSNLDVWAKYSQERFSLFFTPVLESIYNLVQKNKMTQTEFVDITSKMHLDGFLGLLKRMRKYGRNYYLTPEGVKRYHIKPLHHDPE